MRTASSAISTWSASRSASEYTATVLIPMRRAVLVTRQAISPRFAIRIFLNILLFMTFGRGLARDPPKCERFADRITRQSNWSAPGRKTGTHFCWSRSTRNLTCGRGRANCVDSKMSRRQPAAVRPRIAPPASAGISVETSARVGVRDRLHQLAHLGLQKIVGDDKRANGGAQIALAGCDGLIDRGLQLAFLNGIGSRTEGHPVASCDGARAMFSICSHKVNRRRIPHASLRLWMKPRERRYRPQDREALTGAFALWFHTG